LGTGSLLCVVAVMRWAPGVPAILVAIASATAVVAVAGWEERLPVVGFVPAGVPAPSLPGVRADDVVDLLAAGGSVALLVFGSSMLTATALGRRDRESVSPRREFLGFAAASLGPG
jgi:SulP family sulfate permease